MLAYQMVYLKHKLLARVPFASLSVLTTEALDVLFSYER